MTARETIRQYYESLRRGEPLYPYFLEHPDVVKFGVGERLTGYEAIGEGLREQTRTTDEWSVESTDLRVVERPTHAWFSDDVSLSWSNLHADREYEFETRWSGTLEPQPGGGPSDEDTEWVFVGMHVSTPTSGDE
ncbi:MAG: nuclear transport factor 2 family protein [Halobacteriota archaeon]